MEVEVCNLFVIAKSDRPLGRYRMVCTQEHPVDIPTVPLAFVSEALERIVFENRVHQKEFRTGNILGHIQDSIDAIDIIEHALFLYVEAPMSFRDFLTKYANIPGHCTECGKDIKKLAIDQRLAHIICCRWKFTKTILVTAIEVENA